VTGAGEDPVGRGRGRDGNEKLYRIGEVARRARLTRQAIHNYVVLGLIRPARTTPGGQRLFDREVFGRLRLVARLNRSGYTLRDIREIFTREGGR